MKRRRWATVQLGALLAAALLSGCGSENFPVSPTPVATSGVVLQSNHYQGSLTLVSGATTSFNMTMIARGLAGVSGDTRDTGDTTVTISVKAASVTSVTAAAAPLSVTGSFQTGTGLSGTIQGSLTGSLDNGFFNGSLTANAGGASEQQYSGPVSAVSAALAPGECVQGACAADGLTGVIQTVQTTSPAGPAPPPSCTYSLSSTSASFAAAGGTGSTTITATANCGWAAVSTVPWISIVGAATGTSDGTVTYAVQANAGEQRSGSLQVGGQTLVVTQAAVPPCTYSLAPTSESVAAPGASDSVVVTTSCAWTASSDASWITITSGASGTTSGTIAYAVAANGGAQRVGHVTVTGAGGSATLTVTQASPETPPPPPPTPCNRTLNPASRPVAAAGGSFNTVLDQTGACSGTWTAVSDVEWITNVSPSSGTAGARIAYTVQAHTGATERIGHITVTGGGASPVQLTVTQGVPLPCTRTLSPPTQPFPAAGGPFNMVLAQTGACSGSWSVSVDVGPSVVPWITNITPSSGTAGATITFSVQANTGALRNAVFTFTGGVSPAQLTVSQAAAPCTYTLTPNTNTVSSAGGTGFSTALTRTATCTGTWVATSNVPWIQNISPSSGTANATITYAVQTNTGAQRTGTITVQGPGGGIATHTVTQQALVIPLIGSSPRIQPGPTDARQGALRISRLSPRRVYSLTIADASRAAWLTISSSTVNSCRRSSRDFAAPQCHAVFHAPEAIAFVGSSMDRSPS